MTKRISLLILAGLFSFSALARDEYTRTFDRTVPLHGGERVFIEHRLGDIIVHTHPDHDVIVHAEIRVSAGNSSDAKSFADRIQVLLEPSASQLTIRTRYPQQPNSFLGFRNISYFVRYDLTIPESAPLDVRNSFGAVSVSGLKANSDIITSHGDLTFRSGRGTQHLQNSFAAVQVANNVGDTAVENSNGAVDVSDITGALSIRDRFAKITAARVSKGVTVVNSNGQVDVSDSGGVGNVRNSFGNVTISNYRGDITVNNSNGKVDATTVDGFADLNTTFGAVHFADVKSHVSATANNSRIDGERAGGPVTIQNSFGPTTVSDVQGDVTIQSGNGQVSITNIHGAAKVKTSFGLVQATDIAGMLDVQNANGAVKAIRARGASVKTSFGPVILDGISGPIQVDNQNGMVDATSSLQTGCRPITIQTSFSSIRVHIAGQANYRVAARTSFGRIHTDFPLTTSGSMSNDELDGVIGSGRCEMRLTNRNGGIDILKSGS